MSLQIAAQPLPSIGCTLPCATGRCVSSLESVLRSGHGLPQRAPHLMPVRCPEPQALQRNEWGAQPPAAAAAAAARRPARLGRGAAPAITAAAAMETADTGVSAFQEMSAGTERKYIMVSGKGGVGKTSLAASLAVRFAQEGHTTLVVSTDPAHSLGDSLAQVRRQRCCRGRCSIAQAAELVPRLQHARHLWRQLPSL